MDKLMFVGVKRLVQNGKTAFAEVVLQGNFEIYENVQTPFITVQIPVKSINLTKEEQTELETNIRNAIDWEAIHLLALKAE